MTPRPHTPAEGNTAVSITIDWDPARKVWVLRAAHHSYPEARFLRTRRVEATGAPELADLSCLLEAVATEVERWLF